MQYWPEIDRWMNVDGQMDGWKDGWIHEWMNGWMDEWIDRLTKDAQMSHDVMTTYDTI